MNRIRAAASLVLCLILLGCSDQQKYNIEGSWRLVSRTQKNVDTSYINPQSDDVAMMMILKTRLAYFARHTAPGDTTYGYGEGGYELEGNKLTTIYEYHVDRAMIGQPISWEVEIVGDTLIRKGPRNVGGAADGQWEAYEVWRRLN